MNSQSVVGWVERSETQHCYSSSRNFLSHGIPTRIMTGVTCPNFGQMLGHSISIPLVNTYAHFLPTMQDQAAQLMDDILTPIPIELI
jgi:hypothetical protein